MAQVSNRFFVTAIADGQVANGYLRCNMALQQFLNPKTNTCDPDWSVNMVNGTDQTDHPIITAYTRLGGSDKAPQQYKWYWNGAEIEFDGNNSVQTYTKGGQTYPLFIMGTDASNRPTLKINGNIATATNVDQDVISNRGSIESSGELLEYSMDILVRISQLVATGHQGFIEFQNNVAVITEAGGSVTLLPVLYAGTEEVQPADFQVKWYLEGVNDYSSYANPTRFATMKSGTQAQMGLTLTESDITDNVTVRCEFYDKASTPSKLCSAYQEVDDQVDDDYMYITHPQGQSNANLRKTQSVTFTIWMASQNDPTQVKTAYQHFKLKLLNSTGNVITAQIGTPITGDTDYTDITKDDVTVIGTTKAAKAGQVTISFDLAHDNGDTISGVVVAY